MWGWLKRFFSASPSQKSRYYTLYVRPKACKEVLEVRIDTMNDISRTDDGKGYFVRKLARGARCPFHVEIELTFDASLRPQQTTVVNGEEVGYDDYAAFVGLDEKKKV